MLEMDCMTRSLEIETKAVPHKGGGHGCGEGLSPLAVLWMLLQLYPSSFCTGRTAIFKGLWLG